MVLCWFASLRMGDWNGDLEIQKELYSRRLEAAAEAACLHHSLTTPIQETSLDTCVRDLVCNGFP